MGLAVTKLKVKAIAELEMQICVLNIIIYIGADTSPTDETKGAA